MEESDFYDIIANGQWPKNFASPAINGVEELLPSQEVKDTGHPLKQHYDFSERTAGK